MLNCWRVWLKIKPKLLIHHKIYHRIHYFWHHPILTSILVCTVIGSVIVVVPPVFLSPVPVINNVHSTNGEGFNIPSIEYFPEYFPVIEFPSPSLLNVPLELIPANYVLPSNNSSSSTVLEPSSLVLLILALGIFWRKING
jgi:hypothetical protein